MALQFVLGNAGSGKSTLLYKNIIKEAVQNPDKQYIALVPEQFTMQTQKDLVRLHPGRGLLNIDVLSFGRLAYRILEDTHALNRLVLEDTGKSLMIRKIAGEMTDDLKILGRNLKKRGYVSELKSLFSEMTQYDVREEALQSIIEKLPPGSQLSAKLSEVVLLQQQIRAFMEDKYITAEEMLDAACQELDNTGMLEGCTVVLDGFTGFTPLQYKAMAKIMTAAKLVVVSLTADTAGDPYHPGEPHDLFHVTRETIGMLSRLAEETGVGRLQDICIGPEKTRRRYQDADALCWLEQNFLRYYGKKYQGSQDNVRIYQEKNHIEEIHLAGREISRLVREEGLRYKDIAVVLSDMAAFEGHIGRIFDDYQIPYFLDHKRSILLNPFLEFLRALLELTIQNFSYESVFRFLRCGLSPVSGTAADYLENYIRALGIRGFSAWNKKWVRIYRGMDEEQLPGINQSREQLMETLAPLIKVLRSAKKTVREKTAAIYDYICLNQLQEKLAEYEALFRQQGQAALAREYSQIYKIVMDLFDKVVSLLGDEMIPLNEYADILEAGFEEARVGVIPPNIDQVVIGDVERSRLKDIKALFFLGVNDGLVPKNSGGCTILSEMDRTLLGQEKVKLAPTARENSYIQSFYLYMNLTKPARYLYLSYAKVDGEGKGLRPSYLVHAVRDLYQELDIIDGEQQQEQKGYIATAPAGIGRLVEHISGFRDQDYWFKELFVWYKRQPEWQPKIETLIRAASTPVLDQTLSQGTVKALYGSVLENSVTRLERYAACAFAHFLDYGLRLSPRKEYSIQPVDMGNIFHGSLESFSKKLAETGSSWLDVTPDQADVLIEEAVTETAYTYDNTVLAGSHRNEYMVSRIRRMMKRTVHTLQQQISRGEFVPSSYEVSFAMADHLESVNIALSEHEKMRLRGRIDRVDRYEDEKNVYLRVIDYKSGNTSFDLVALYHGLQLQLVVYMNAAVEMEKKAKPDKEVVPAGIFYYRIQDPMIDKQGTADPEAIEQSILEKLKMDGLVNDNPEIVSKQDGEIEKSSAVIPVSLNKDGSFSKNSAVASEEDFQILSGYVNRKMKEIGTDILKGSLGASPYQRKDRTACDYCDYRSVCGFDESIPGCSYRRLKEFKKEEVLEQMEKEAEE